jgi:polysaccharide biosynthesis protein PslH
MPAHLLFLTHEPPLPLASGARLRSYHLMRELERRGHAVSLFALVSGGPVPTAAEQQLVELCQRVQLWPFEPNRLRRRAQLAADYAFRRAFERRYFYSRPAADAAAKLVQELRPDAIVVGQLYMEPYLPRLAEAVTILDSHNAEARRIATMARAAGLRGLVARRQARPVAEYEAATVARFGRTWAVSHEEREYFEPLAPARVDVVPNGVDCAALPARSRPAEGTDVLFLGRMDYGPNVDGARQLVEEILPHVRRHDVHLQIVGANPPPAIRRLAASAPVRVDVTGFVPDTAPYLASARMLVVPLRVGGGTRLKILEALARGVPVITTSLGGEGLDLKHGEDALIADDPTRFGRYIDQLLEDDELCASLARQGRATVERHFDWAAIGDLAEASLQRLLTQRDAQSSSV